MRRHSGNESERRLAKWFGLFLVAFCSLECNAFNPEIQWYVVGIPETFATKAEAVSRLHQVSNDHARLTVESRVTEISENSETYQYEAPKVAPVPEPWRYFDLLWGAPNPPGYLSSEAGWVADRLSRTWSAPECPPKTLTAETQWMPETFGYGGVPNRERRTYRRKIYASGCHLQEADIYAVRERQTPCPAGYWGEGVAPGCYFPLTARISGTRTYLEGCPSGIRGNPCDALTGDKFETARDYQGPNGLLFERYFHSRSSDATNGMGTGWSHNYQARVLISNGGTLFGLVRPNGYRESFSGSLSVNGLVVKKVSGSLWQVFLSDGAVESYNGSGRLISIERPAGGTITLSYSGAQLVSVANAFGHSLQFQYDSSGRLDSVTTPASQTIQFHYTDDNLISVTNADGTVRQYHYEHSSFPSHLTGITDEGLSRFSTYDYDSLGKL